MRRLIPTVLLILGVAAACSGGGEEAASAPGADLLAGGRQVYDGGCTPCHGPSGGGGVGPALDSVAITFPDCEEQVRWVTLGSSGWGNEVGPTFGATPNQVRGGMPSFERILSADEIRLVVAWTRAQFSGETPLGAAEACGVTIP